MTSAWLNRYGSQQTDIETIQSTLVSQLGQIGQYFGSTSVGALRGSGLVHFRLGRARLASSSLTVTFQSLE